VHYEGKLLNGQVFDSSLKRGEPAEFPLNGVIPGWTEALQRMAVGDKWQLFIPPDLAYGMNGAPGGKIGPNEALVFEVELLDIVR
jgi:FKBP-type peptidyl-prolyl cis-trans isomerase FklB